jgi:hypothetical protein
MKVGNTKFVRWATKLVTKQPVQQPHQRSERLIVLNDDQMQKVAGGSGNSTSTPYKGW